MSRYTSYPVAFVDTVQLNVPDIASPVALFAGEDNANAAGGAWIVAKLQGEPVAVTESAEFLATTFQ